MDEQPTQVPAEPTGIASNLDTSIDPLRRGFQPTEAQTPNGTWVFRTRDNVLYTRAKDNSIHRVNAKVNGKAARKLRARARKLGKAGEVQ